MWRSSSKKGKAVRRWHSRAWLIDLSKTRVTFLQTEPADMDESNGAEEPKVECSSVETKLLQYERLALSTTPPFSLSDDACATPPHDARAVAPAYELLITRMPKPLSIGKKKDNGLLTNPTMFLRELFYGDAHSRTFTKP